MIVFKRSKGNNWSGNVNRVYYLGGRRTGTMQLSRYGYLNVFLPFRFLDRDGAPPWLICVFSVKSILRPRLS